MSNPISNTSSATLKSLETLRIAAAIAVVFAHSIAFEIPFLKPFLGGSYFVGSIGVDIFFVISGFVMGVAAFRSGSGVQAAKSFILSRLLRLFPLYALLTSLASAYLIARGVKIEIGHFLQSIFFLPTFSGDQALDPIMAMGWTLRFEMYFYLLVAGGIAANRKILVPVAGILASFGFWLISGFYYGAPLVLEFIAGYLLNAHRGTLLDGIRARFGSRVFVVGLLLSVALLLAAATGKDWGDAGHGIYGMIPRLWITYAEFELPRVIAWGIPAVAVIYFCIGLESDLKWRTALLGKYTYSVYLVQFFVLPIVMRVDNIRWMPDVGVFVCEAVLIAVGSVLAFRLIESPALKLRRHFAPKVAAMPMPEPTGAAKSEQA